MNVNQANASILGADAPTPAGEVLSAAHNAEFIADRLGCIESRMAGLIFRLFSPELSKESSAISAEEVEGELARLHRAGRVQMFTIERIEVLLSRLEEL